MTKDTWWCGLCAASGEIVLPDGIDVYSAVNLLNEAHDAISPDCQRAIRIEQGEPVAPEPAHD